MNGIVSERLRDAWKMGAIEHTAFSESRQKLLKDFEASSRQGVRMEPACDSFETWRAAVMQCKRATSLLGQQCVIFSMLHRDGECGMGTESI